MRLCDSLRVFFLISQNIHFCLGHLHHQPQTTDNRVFDIRSLIWDELLLLCRLSEQRIVGPFWNQKKIWTYLDVLACLGVNPLDMPRTPYRMIEGNTLNNPPCPITQPHVIICTSFISIKILHCSFRITMSPK